MVGSGTFTASIFRILVFNVLSLTPSFYKAPSHSNLFDDSLQGLAPKAKRPKGRSDRDIMFKRPFVSRLSSFLKFFGSFNPSAQLSPSCSLLQLCRFKSLTDFYRISTSLFLQSQATTSSHLLIAVGISETLATIFLSCKHQSPTMCAGLDAYLCRRLRNMAAPINNQNQLDNGNSTPSS